MSPEALAARVLDLVRRAHPSAQAAVTVNREALALTRFAESFIHQNVVDETDRVQLMVHVDGRTALVEGNRTGPHELAALVASALAAAALSPRDEAFPGLAPTAPLLGTGNWDETTAAADPHARAAVVRDFVAAAAGLACAGYCQTALVRAAFANTAGQSVSGATTEASVSAIARTGRSDGVARDAAVSLSALDGRALGAAAAAKARAGVDQVELLPGRYEVVLDAGAVADLVSGLLMQGLNGKAVAEGRSFARVGTAQFDPAVTLRDDSTDARATGLPFDTEGTPKRPLDLVRAGVTTHIPHDRRTAAACGTESTGSAVPGGDRWGAFPSDVRLDPGDTGDGPLDLVAGVEKGLLVSDFWYTRVLDPRTLVYTGLTRNGVWLIEDGQLGSAVSTLRFTQSYVDALGPGAVLAVSREQYAVPGGVGPMTGGTGHMLVPALRLASWNITGGAAG